MKILLTGGSGVIGSKLVSDFVADGNDVMYTYLSRNIPVEGAQTAELDITKREDTASLIGGFDPDLVFHCSALTKVDLCETDPKLADRINVQGTKNVVDAAKRSGSKTVYISTSFVFDGKKKTFDENDKTNPVDEYGLTKLKGEDIVKKSGLPFLILRTDHPYRWSPSHLEKNNVMRLINLFEKGEKFNEATDWYNTPTLVDNFSNAARTLIRKWEDGIYHVVGSDFVNRYDFAAKVADLMGGDKKLINKIKASDLKLPAKRPNVHMVNEKIQEKTGVKMFGIEDGIKIVMKQRKLSKR